MRRRSLAVILSAFVLTSCNGDNEKLGKLYSRSLVISNVQDAEIPALLRTMAESTNTSEKEVRKDLDGNNMFLYSGDNVVLFVRRKFGEQCTNGLCSWKINVSPAKTNMHTDEQKAVVDEAFNHLASIGYIADHRASGGA